MIVNWQSRLAGLRTAAMVAATITVWPEAGAGAGPFTARVTQAGVEAGQTLGAAYVTQAGVEPAQGLGRVYVTQVGVEIVRPLCGCPGDLGPPRTDGLPYVPPDLTPCAGSGTKGSPRTGT